jgi:guanylate kinase
MSNHKRIILVGPTCSGKTYIRDKFREKGFKVDVSWTSRPKRENEIQDFDYYFTSKEYFELLIQEGDFYEWVKYGDYYYGTGMEEWEKLSQVFIMETDGISKIKPEDRKNCLIIYVDTPLQTRLDRMKERGWNEHKIIERAKVDQEKFKNFKDYDLKISSE